MATLLLTQEQLAEYESRATMAERRRCAAAIEAMLSPESGAEYGMASDEHRKQIRSHNSTLRCAVECVRKLET